MTIRYAAKHGTNLVNTINAIKTFEPFKAGNLRADRATIPGYIGPTGELPKEWRDQMVKDAPLYVIYSYATPIAWLANRETGKIWVLPDVKYSPTTSARQSVVRRSVPEYESTNAAIKLAQIID